MKRKIIGIILAMILVIPNTVFAAANLVNIDDVVTSFNKSKTISSFDELFGIETVMKINKTAKTLDVTVDNNTETISFKYTNEYIEFDNRSFTPTRENIGKTIFQSVQVLGITDALINLSGFENKTLKENTIPTDYNKYGLTIETGEYTSNESSNGVTENISVEYLKYFKISLDKTKIQNLVKDYGRDISDSENPLLNEAKPALGFYTQNSEIVLQVYLNKVYYTSANPVYVDIYRANSIDGEYIKVNTDKIDGTKDNATFIDKSAEGNRTYYYKAVMVDSNIESDILTVTTFPKITTQPVENPKTGISSPFIIIPITITFALIYFIIKKKSLFRSI